MNESNVINSTEKLLNTIRGGALPSPEKPIIPLKYAQHEASLKVNIRNSLTAGVFIEDRFISLVLTGERNLRSGRELLKWAHVEIPIHLDIDNINFSSFLRSSLSEFFGKYKNVAIWTAIDSKDLKLRNLNIPDVPDAKAANAALWGLKKEFEIDAENEIFDYEFIEETQVNGIKKKTVVAFAGDKKQIFFLKQLFSTAGYPLTGITTMAFAMQNFIWTNKIKAGPMPIVIVNVARYYSEISCLSDKGVLLTRNIRTGSYSLVEELLDIKDEAVKNTDITGILTSALVQNSPEFKLIEPSIDRLLGKVIRTGDYCSNNFAANEPVSKFLFFGETDDCKAFMEYTAEQLAGKVEKFSPFGDQSLPLSVKMPLGALERAGIIPALGIALSENEYTPNFLFTYLQRSIEAKYRKMNWAIAAACLVCLMICRGVWGWMNTLKNTELSQKAAIEKQLTQYTPIVTQQLLTEKISSAKKKSEMLNQYARDYIPLAVISEICSLTPKKISIISFDSDFTKTSPETNKSPAEKKEPQEEKKRSVTLKGIVTAEFTDLESTLTGYVITLGDSPLFGDIRLKDKEIEKKANSTILKFTAEMEIL